jgi:hypothetical protein
MYTMQENIFIIEAYFRSHPLPINHIWNFDVYFEVEVKYECEYGLIARLAFPSFYDTQPQQTVKWFT